METEEALKKKKAEEEKAALLKRLLDVREYMQLVEIIRNDFPFPVSSLRQLSQRSKQQKEKEETALRNSLKRSKNERHSKFKKLNDATLDALIAFSCDIPIDINMKKDDFKDDAAVGKWFYSLKATDYYGLSKLHDDLAELEKNQKYARRWYKASEIIYVAAQSIGPLAEVPFLHFAIHPVMNGLYGLSYIARGVSMKYDPALGDRVDTARTTFDKLSMGTSILSTLSAISMLIPVTLPISLPIFLFSMLTSNILSTVSSVIDLVQAAKKPDVTETKSLKWRIAEKSSSTLFNLVGIVAACLLIAAFFTPVGWAAGGAALAFGLGTAAACLAVFGVQKFCEWRAKKAEKKEAKNREIEMESIKKEKAKTGENNKPEDKKPKPIVEADLAPEPKAEEKRKYLLFRYTLDTPRAETLRPSLETQFTKATFHEKVEKSVSNLELQKHNVTTNIDDNRLLVKIQPSGVSTENQKEKVKCTHTDTKQVEISLTANPSDKAIFVMLDTSRPFMPLTMDPCDNALVALKIFEAAKLRDMKVTLAPEDEALINADPDQKKYLEKIKPLSSEAFKKMKGKAPLGEIPPERPSARPKTP